MKHLLSLFVVLFGFTTMQAQFPGQTGIKSPVKWSGTVKKESADSFNLVFKAQIENGWHIFSQFTAPGGSLPMQITYLDDGDGYQTTGKTKESETETRFNDVFGVKETIFEEQAVLTQNIALENPDQRYVKAIMSYQVCKQSCINQEFYFVFDLKEQSAKIFKNFDRFKSFGAEVAKEKSASQSANDPAGISGVGIPGQDMKSPVSWEGRVKSTSENTYDLVFEAQIENGWHIFSQFTAPGGSLPMLIDFLNDEKKFERNGKAEESKTETRFNDVFGVKETIFEGKAVVTQNITVKNTDLRYVKAIMSYQVCKQSCINQEFYFVFDLKEQHATIFKNFDKFKAFGEGNANQVAQSGTTDKVAKADADHAAASVDDSSKENDSRGLWTIFVLAFLWGFTALLTPCVFPMIPMTVSFFIKQSKTKARGKSNALLYSLFIVVIYVLLGTLVTAIFGADALNKLSTNPTFNIVFFLLLVVFAASFLGAFEIVLPNSWANKADKQANRGGIVGIFFMALALAIVSFSCTGPIIGFVLVQAASSGGMAPIVGMLGFSLALAIPFGLFALFPGWLNSMPKSGGWLNTVKVFLGFLELAFAFKFLSNADLVLQAHLLPREVFLAIWIAIFGVMALYLLGKISLPHDSKIEHISVGRLGLGLLALAFTIYLIPGLWGAPLKMISGFPPPMTYSESPDGVGYSKVGTVLTSAKDYPENAESGPQNIMVFKDYEEGLAYAKKVNKPVMLDFTGMACVNCRKMEERVWSEPEVLSILKNDVVLISLYVDIKKELPKETQYTSETTGKRIRTVGDKWSDFQISHYGVNAQPYYVIISPKTEENLNKPVGYTPDAQEYKSWLMEGINAYEAN